jgi:hypothetical protein
MKRAETARHAKARARLGRKRNPRAKGTKAMMVTPAKPCSQ